MAAAIHHTVGATYSAIGEYDSALDHLNEARRLWQKIEGPWGEGTLLTLVELALLGPSG